MNWLIVVSWVAMGFFAAWIGTHLEKDRVSAGGIANLAVGVLGALLGGLVMYSVFHTHAKNAYNAFTVSAVGALLAASLLMGLTRVAPHRRPHSHVS